MPYSNCCGAFTNMEELGICPECKDHCEFEEECNNCNGVGEVEGLGCYECDGTGMKTIEA